MPTETNHFQIHLENAAGDRHRVYRLKGREEISRLFDFTIDAAIPAAVDPESLLATAWTIVFELDDKVVRRVAGMIAEVEDRFEDQWGATETLPMRLRLVPRVWRWSLRESCDVYVDESASDIIKDRLEAAGLAPEDYALRLAQTYPKREFVVQYKETDLAYVSRTCENLGISFFFAEKDGADIVIFTDGNSGFDDVGTVRYSGRGARVGVYHLGARVREIPKKFVVRDYNYRTPQVDLLGEATLPVGDMEVVEYGTHFKTTKEGTYMAGLRAQERLASRKQYRGESVQAELRAGAFVTIQDTPDGDLQVLVTAVEHEAHLDSFVRDNQSTQDAYVNRFTALAKVTVYRPQRITPKPRVSGVITGMIDAEKTSEYAQLDDQGRYAVRFIFDTSDAASGHASHRVRMIQPHSGAGYGMHFPLRPGVEVVLTCIDGDPDRPIIAGTVPNALTQSPVTAGNSQRNVIRTGGGNEFNLDDTSGSERIKMSTPHTSTSFQLGAPNLQESGAMLNTLGASTTVAQLGIGRISGFAASIQPLSVFTSGGDITTDAEKITGWKKALAVLGSLDGLAQAASGIIQLTISARTLYVGTLQHDQAKKADDQATQLAKMNAQAAPIDVAIAAYANSTPAPNATDPVLVAYANYKAALANYQSAIATRDSDRDTFFVAQRQNTDNESDSSLTGDADSVITMYESGYPSATYTKQGLQDATVYAAALQVKKDEAAIATARAAIEGTEPPTGDTLLALKNACAASGNKSVAALDVSTAGNNYLTQAGTYSSDVDATSSARKTANDATYVTQNDPGWVMAQEAQVGLTLVDSAYQLFSSILALITAIKTLAAKFKNIERWTEFAKAFKEAAPELLKDPTTVYNPLTAANSRPVHKLGSDNTILLDAKKHLGEFAPTIALHGYQPLAVVTATATLDAAATALADAEEELTKARAELAKAKPKKKPPLKAAVTTARETRNTARATHKEAAQALATLQATLGDGVVGIVADTIATLASKANAEVVAGEELLLTAGSRLAAKAGGAAAVSADDAITITSANKGVSLTAKTTVNLTGATVSGTATTSVAFNSDDSMTLGADNKIDLTSEAILIDGSPTGTTTVKGKTILVDAGDAGKITLKCGTYQIQITPTGISAGKVAAGIFAPALLLKDEQAVVGAGPASMLKVTKQDVAIQCAPTSVKVASSGITQQGALLQHG